MSRSGLAVVAAFALCSCAPRYRFPPPVAPRVGQVEEGVASWYGPGYDGNRTSSGEVFDQDALTAAHARYVFGTRVRVTLLSTGRSVVVRINDRFPNHKGRVIDVSREAARRIGLIGPGTGRVRLEIVGAEEPPALAAAAAAAPTAPRHAAAGGRRDDFVGGEHVTLPAEGLRHQAVHRNLVRLFQQALAADRDSGLQPTPPEVALGPRDRMRPDLAFVSPGTGIPRLVIEIVSDPERRAAEPFRRQIYERHGVGEYWRVDVAAETVLVYRLTSAPEGFEPVAEFSRDAASVVATPLLPGLSAPLDLIFE